MYFLVKVFTVLLIGTLLEAEVRFSDFSSIARYDQKIFSFYTDPCCTASEANETCNKINGYLARVKSESIQSFLKEKLYDYTTHTGAVLKDGFWIGLHQVGEDKRKYKWSDGTNYAYDNWYENQPDSRDEKCVVILSTMQSFPQKPVAFSFWADCECANVNKFVCENDFGSGFLSKSNIKVESKQASVTCTVLGDSAYSAVWVRKGVPVSMEKSEKIYQENYLYSNEYIKSSIIRFTSLSVEDVGDFTCLLKFSNKFYDRKLKEMDLTVDTILNSNDDESNSLTFDLLLILGVVAFVIIGCLITTCNSPENKKKKKKHKKKKKKNKSLKKLMKRKDKSKKKQHKSKQTKHKKNKDSKKEGKRIKDSDVRLDSSDEDDDSKLDIPEEIKVETQPENSPIEITSVTLSQSNNIADIP